MVTYDEFGGQWDHVSPPGAGSPTPGVHDQVGPGTRDPGAGAQPVIQAVGRRPHRRTTPRRSWPPSSTAWIGAAEHPGRGRR